MDIIVNRKCNLFITLIQILDFCANENFEESARLNLEPIYKDIDKLSNIIRKSSYIDDIKLFFKFYTSRHMKHNQLSLSISKYLWSSTNFYDKDFTETVEDIMNCELNDFLPLILIDLQNSIEDNSCYQEAILSMNEEEMTKEIKRCLKISPLSSEIKWSIFSLVDDFDDIKFKYCDLLIKCYEEFQPQLLKLSKKLDKWCDYIEAKILKEGIKFLEDVLYLEVLESFNRIYIYGSLLINYGSILKDTGDGDLYLGLGMNIDKYLMNLRGVSDKEWFINSTKVLTDQSKFNILKLLSDKSMYGGQLAEALKLTTATISHHISALREADFIHEEVSSNKIFYTINKDSLEKWVRMFSEELKLK